ncbi:MAG: hypothetical protein KJP23_20665 [Deltaproteobacteria bacterium]|nr:hypothetical protein [Deltaproteobacteria bacterium]
MIKKLVFVNFTAIIFAFSTSALAGWELYDNFSSGAIDTQRWSIDDSSANISVVNGQAQFIHQSGHPNDSGYLVFNQNPENILGINTDVVIESCFGDVRTRIGGYGGKVGENHVWSGIQIQPTNQTIFTSAGLEGPPPDYTWVQDLHYAEYRTPIAVTGVSFNLTMVFSNDKITYEVDSLGKIAYKYATTIAPADSTFQGMGTRSSNGDGPCTAYFDNVYVLRP